MAKKSAVRVTPSTGNVFRDLGFPIAEAEHLLVRADLLIQVQPSSVNAGLCYMARGVVPPPDWEVFVYHRHLRILAALWKQAR